MVLRHIAVVASLLSVAPACLAAGEPIVMYYVQRLPFMGRDPEGKLDGILIPLVASAFAKAGIPVDWRESSTTRQLAVIQANAERACSLGRYKTADRAAYAKFSVPFYQDLPWVGLANVNFDVSDHARIADLMMDPQATILLKDDIKLGPYVDGLIAKMKAKRIGVTSDFDQIIRMIQAGRADFSLISGEEEIYYRNKPGFTDHNVRIIHFADMPPGEKRYLMCSKMVDDTVIDKINAALK